MLSPGRLPASLHLDLTRLEGTYKEGLYEIDQLTCPACGSEMKPIAFITNYEVIDKIIHHLGITFTATRPPPPHQQEELY